MKKIAYYSDLLFCFFAVGIFCLCYFRHQNLPLLLALLLGGSFGASASLFLSVFLSKKRNAVLLKKREAEEAEKLDEVPVGAVAVRGGVIVGEGYNTRESEKCALGHAECNAIRAACANMGGWRLPGVTLYVTMEPCAMCAGAIINSRIPRVVFGANDLRFGAFGSLINLAEVPLNHTPEIIGGVLGDECRAVLQAYFKKKRQK